MDANLRICITNIKIVLKHFISKSWIRSHRTRIRRGRRFLEGSKVQLLPEFHMMTYGVLIGLAEVAKGS